MYIYIYIFIYIQTCRRPDRWPGKEADRIIENAPGDLSKRHPRTMKPTPRDHSKRPGDNSKRRPGSI